MQVAAKSPSLTSFTFELEPESAEKLARAAEERGTSTQELMACVTEQFLAEDEVKYEFTPEDIEAIEEGVAQLRRGEGIPHEQVVAEMRAKYGV